MSIAKPRKGSQLAQQPGERAVAALATLARLLTLEVGRATAHQTSVGELETVTAAVERLNDAVSDRYQAHDQPSSTSRTTDLI